LKKILIVFGTRPEAIKMAPLVKGFQMYPDKFETKVCVTAQHRQMLDQVLEVFEIVPDFDLNIMAPNQDLFDITSKVLLGMRAVFNEYLPDVVLVHGDTTTSMTTSIAAFYKQIKIGHVEAGLRTYNLMAPWPEEMNRQVTDRMTDYYFAPTETSKQNLLQEGIKENNILVTGNTVIDALLMAIDIIETKPGLKEQIEASIIEKGFPLIQNRFSSDRKIILVTGHRRENFGEGFLNICTAIKEIAFKNQGFDIVYPVHLNPNVQKPVYELLKQIKNVYLISPLDYLPFVYLMKNAHIILTDSGGIQEEAPTLLKPVLVMRDITERPEALTVGTVKLVGTNTAKIVNSVNELIENKNAYQSMANGQNPYGDGNACKNIINFLFEKV
jgi:UDP-N-acetylglucosamine 2-epimerase (non-hydrolysing)